MPWSVVDFLSWVPVRLNVIEVEVERKRTKMYHTLWRKGNIHNFKRNRQNFSLCHGMAWHGVACRALCVP